jgi:hypothetical protein
LISNISCRSAAGPDSVSLRVGPGGDAQTLEDLLSVVSARLGDR